MFEVKLLKEVDLKKCTLIVPSVSVGNVAQLATDLLINSLNTEKIGYIYTSYLHPLVGNEAFRGGADKNKGNISTACEIFQCRDFPVLIVQQRSPIVKGRSCDYRFKLKSWFKESDFERVIILTGSFAHQRNDAQITQDILCRYMTSAKSGDNEYLESVLNWKRMEPKDDLNDWQPLLIPGSGIAHKLFSDCEEAGIRTLLCIIFCSEGNNFPEASQLASYVYEWMKFYFKLVEKSDKFNWVTPVSWSCLFGKAVNNTIF